MTNTNTEKMTYVAALTYTLDNVSDLPADVREKLDALRGTLEKRAAAPKKPSKSQQENATHKVNLLAALAAADAPMGIADLREAVEGDLTPNKVSALMGQLVTEGKATRIPGKGKDRKVTFTLA